MVLFRPKQIDQGPNHLLERGFPVDGFDLQTDDRVMQALSQHEELAVLRGSEPHPYAFQIVRVDPPLALLLFHAGPLDLQGAIIKHLLHRGERPVPDAQAEFVDFGQFLQIGDQRQQRVVVVVVVAVPPSSLFGQQTDHLARRVRPVIQIIVLAHGAMSARFNGQFGRGPAGHGQLLGLVDHVGVSLEITDMAQAELVLQERAQTLRRHRVGHDGTAGDGIRRT